MTIGAAVYGIYNLPGRTLTFFFSSLGSLSYANLVKYGSN